MDFNTNINMIETRVRGLKPARADDEPASWGQVKRLVLRVALGLGLVLLATLVLAVAANASTGDVAGTDASSYPLFWSALLSAVLGPLGTYLLHTKLWKSLPETIVEITLVVVSAIVAGVTDAVTATNFVLFSDSTYWTILISVATAVAAHHGVWKPTVGKIARRGLR